MSLWRGQRVLITGHTGFKGAWLARWLAGEGALVSGLSLPPEPGPQLSRMLGAQHLTAEYLIDLRDAEAVQFAVAEAAPQIVLHLAAQPIVKLSYADPVGTIGTNVQGTAHLLDALRGLEDLSTVLVVTSDKVYANDETGRAFAENDRLGGHDPYSASKAATELIVASFAASYFKPAGVRVATARGGNVIGGGDFGEQRLIPDIIRAAGLGQTVTLRHPEATRPWQHVLDCLSGYLTFAEAMIEGHDLPDALNFGPAADDVTVTVGDLVTKFQTAIGQTQEWTHEQHADHEMSQLSIDATASARVLNWRPKLSIDTAVEWTADWYKLFLDDGDMTAKTDSQIAAYKEICS